MGEEIGVDQVPAQGRVVVVQPEQDPVDLRLLGATAGLEERRHTLEQQAPAPCPGHRGDPAVRDERAEVLPRRPVVVGRRLQRVGGHADKDPTEGRFGAFRPPRPVAGRASIVGDALLRHLDFGDTSHEEKNLR